MAKNYTSLSQCINDVQLYCILQTGGQQTLNMFPAIAQSKIPWFSNNWPKLYADFKALADGDEGLELSLASFDQFIKLYNIINISTTNTANLINSAEAKNSLTSMTAFFATINIDTVQLTDQEQDFVNKEIGRINALTMDDFQSIRDYLRTQSSIAAILIGKGDPEGNKLMGTAGVKQREAQPDDYDAIGNIIDLIDIVDGLIFNFRNTEDKAPDLLTFAANNTDPTSDFDVQTGYYSSIAAPFEESLENMAQKYLGDKTRWYELATVNNLQSPYVDESGTKEPLIVPALQSSVVISNEHTAFCPVGQKVSVGSAKVREEIRTILSKIESNDGTITLFLSGEPDLTKLLPSENAYARVFRPHTVRSTSFVLIPLPTIVTEATTFTPKSDALRSLDKALLAFGVDIKRDTITGEYLIDANGNFVMCWGLDNVRQTIHFLLRTQVGELPFHQDYGIDSQIGTTIVVGDEGEKIAGLIENSILQDSRFEYVAVRRVRTFGTAVSIDILVAISGATTAVPLSFIL